MKDRNISSRKKEFERRSITIDAYRDKWFVDVIKETKAAAAAITAGNTV